jgi:hypothetical protein
LWGNAGAWIQPRKVLHHVSDAARKTLSVIVLKNKKAETVVAAIKKVHNMMKNVSSHSLKRLHTDNGSEYDNDLILGYLEGEGIEHSSI